MNQVTLNLMQLTPTTIVAIIEDLREHAQDSLSAEAAIWKLATQLEALVGKEEAEEMLNGSILRIQN